MEKAARGASERNQRRLITDPAVLAAIDELLTLVERQTRTIEEEIATLIAADPLRTQLDREFRSIKGVATRTVAPLMAEMPEIGTLSNKSISKLAGFAAAGVLFSQALKPCPDTERARYGEGGALTRAAGFFRKL